MWWPTFVKIISESYQLRILPKTETPWKSNSSFAMMLHRFYILRLFIEMEKFFFFFLFFILPFACLRSRFLTKLLVPPSLTLRRKSAFITSLSSYWFRLWHQLKLKLHLFHFNHSIQFNNRDEEVTFIEANNVQSVVT